MAGNLGPIDRYKQGLFNNTIFKEDFDIDIKVAKIKQLEYKIKVFPILI